MHSTRLKHDTGLFVSMGGKFSQQQVAHLQELKELTDSSIKLASHGGRTLPRLKNKEIITLITYLWKQCPTYPEKGTLKLSTWKKLGEYFHSPPRAPIQILTTWRIIMECLMIHYKFGNQNIADAVPPSYDSVVKKSTDICLVNSKLETSVATAPSCPPFPGPSSAQPPPVGGQLVRAMLEARAKGDLDLEEMEACAAFPVDFVLPAGAAPGAAAAPVYSPLGFKVVKDIKTAVVTYGLQSRFAQGMLYSLANAASEMLICDWQMLLNMILTPAQYVVWWSEYQKQVKIAVTAGLPANVTEHHLLGTGTINTIAAQTQTDRAAFPIISQAAMSALRKVDDSATKPTQTFSKIIQGATENYSEFLSRLHLAVERQIDNENAQNELLLKLAFENANKDCQKVLQPIANKPGVTLADFLEACRIVGTTSHKMEVLAAALYQTPPLPVSSSRPAGNCFNCGKPGHFKAQCRAPGGGASRGNAQSAKPKTVCPRCKKGFHWANQCRVKLNSPMSEN